MTRDQQLSLTRLAAHMARALPDAGVTDIAIFCAELTRAERAYTRTDAPPNVQRISWRLQAVALTVCRTACVETGGVRVTVTGLPAECSNNVGGGVAAVWL